MRFWDGIGAATTLEEGIAKRIDASTDFPVFFNCFGPTTIRFTATRRPVADLRIHTSGLDDRPRLEYFLPTTGVRTIDPENFK